MTKKIIKRNSPQHRLLSFFIWFSKKNWSPPTTKEISDEMGYSIVTAATYLKNLCEAEKLIRVNYNLYRYAKRYNKINKKKG